MKNKWFKWQNIVALTVLIVLGATPLVNEAIEASQERPNIIFILTDDFDYALMPYMTNTNRLIADEGAVLTNYFVTSSACCPSRSSTFRGQYPHNTTILENSPGFKKFYRNGKTKDTIATWMKRAYYQNSFMGKYLNLYPLGAPENYIAPGWDDWHVFVDDGTPFYFAYTMNENGEYVRYHKKEYDYSTDVIAGLAQSFIESSIENKKPFFVYLSVYAPHGPSIPAPRHSQLYLDLTYPKKPSFREVDISDKPQIIQDLSKKDGAYEAEDSPDNQFAKRVQTMQAVDEMVASLVKLLDEKGQLENTYIFFTSDNGFHMGEHSLPNGKMLAYEEDIHVPLVVRGPGIQPGTTVTQMTANIDIAPTIAALAGARAASFVDGSSFGPFLFPTSEQPAGWRKALLIETGDLDRESPVIAYRAVRTENFIYIEYEDGELEFYDLIKDPYEMENLAGKLAPETLTTLHNWLGQLKTCKANECRQLEMNVPDIDY